MIGVRLYTRRDCHLCEQVLENLALLQDEFPHELLVIDIDSDPKLFKKYNLEIPVVEIGSYRLKAPISSQELRMTLSAAQDRAKHIDKIEADRQARTDNVWTRSDGVTYWISRHYLFLLNLIILIYVGLPFLAPVFMKAGATTPANMIYKAYSFVCHQLAYRSIFLFDGQLFYPRSAAGIDGLVTYAQATGLDEGSSYQELYAARTFIGNESIGYKVALCERDVAIYLSIFLFGLIFAISGRRLPPLPWYLWVLIGIVPIALDGLSQWVSQPPFNFIPYRESTPFLRILTGALFGFTTAWFGYPLMDETMRDTQRMMRDKFSRVRQQDKLDKNAIPSA